MEHDPHQPPPEPTHPGEYLLDELNARGMTQTQLARLSSLSVKHVNRLVNRKVRLTPTVAIKIERALDPGVALVLTRLQADYDTHAARTAQPKGTS